MHLADIQNLIINDKKTLKDGIVRIESGHCKIALIVNNKNILLGILSDGDVRRALLRNISLDECVTKAMNKNFIYAVKGASSKEIYELMSKYSIQQVPILDQENQLKELYIHNSIVYGKQKTLKNTVVIMAGGEGKRLRPLTNDCPKPMIKVNGKAMLEILIEKLVESGFRNFFISVNYLKEQIIDYFQDGESWGINIEYLIENKPLGTAGSLTLLPRIEDPILVLNADVLTKLDLKKLLNFHNKNSAKATLSVLNSEFQIPFGVVKTKGINLVEFEEKPTHKHIVNAGVYVVNPEIISILKKDQFTDMPTLMMEALKIGHKVIVCPIHEYWIDIGRPEKLNQAIIDSKENII